MDGLATHVERSGSIQIQHQCTSDLVLFIVECVVSPCALRVRGRIKVTPFHYVFSLYSLHGCKEVPRIVVEVKREMFTYKDQSETFSSALY